MITKKSLLELLANIPDDTEFRSPDDLELFVADSLDITKCGRNIILTITDVDPKEEA